MVGGRHEHALSSVVFHHLQNRVHDATQFPVFKNVFPLLTKGIEFVEEQY